MIKNELMKIVLTGSLGHIGKPLSQQLVAAGHQVTVISSNAAKQQEIEALGATAAIGSVADAAFLATACSGADALYVMIPPDFGQTDQIAYYKGLGQTYAAVIRQSGVQRVVHLSSYGAHLPSGTGFISGSYAVEQLLNAIPSITLTHVRPTFFYYNLLHFIPMIRAAGFIGAVYGGTDRLSMVAPEDIALAIAEELQVATNADRIRYVASDDRTCQEVAALLGNVIGIPGLEWQTLPEDQVLAALLGNGMPQNAALNLVELGLALHSGKLREDYDRQVIAMGKISLETYAVEFARIYNNQ